jgi:outer membrane protein assembly factor BamB
MPARKNSPVCVIISALLVACSGQPSFGVPSDEWPRFRGPHGSGISDTTGVPVELGPADNLIWKADCGSGFSSPIVVSKHLFYTSFRDTERLVHCLDASTGKEHWSRSIPRLRNEPATPPSGPANPTPVADDSNVYVFFPDAGVACFSHAGDERWRIDAGPFQSFHGVSSSLILIDGLVVLLVDQVENSFMAAYDTRDGKPAWKIKRDDATLGGYSTPATRRSSEANPLQGATTELVVAGPTTVAAFNPADGKRVWSLAGYTNAPISTPVIDRNRVFVCEPSFSENPFKFEMLLPFDTNKDGKVSLDELKSQPQLYRTARRVDEHSGNSDGVVEPAELEKAFAGFVGGGGLVAIELDTDGGQTKPRVLWTYRRLVPHIASLLLYGESLFFINEGGILTSLDPETGKISKQARLGHGSGYYASPVAAEGRIYLIDVDGKLAVVSAEPQWKVLFTSDFGESCRSTPAIAHGRIYVRTETKLYCFGKKSL